MDAETINRLMENVIRDGSVAYRIIPPSQLFRGYEPRDPFSNRTGAYVLLSAVKETAR